MLVPGFFLIGLFFIALQCTVCMPHPLWLFAPDFVYVLMAFLAIRFDSIRSLLVLFPLSLIFDVFSGTLTGMYPAILLGGYFLLRLVNSRLPVRTSLYQIPLVGVSYLAVTWLAHRGFDFLEPGEMLPWSWPKSLVRALLVVLLTLPLFRLLEWCSRIFQLRPGSLKFLRIQGGNRRRGPV